MTLDIRNWRNIDEAYLTEALSNNGIDATVTGIKKEPVGTGQIGDCIRFTLDYSSAAPNAPRTVVGKFLADDESSRATGMALGNYVREVKFYEQLKPKARITTPDCYFADVNDETHEFVLLMSDAAPAVQGDQLKGLNIEETKLMLGEAAKLHSAFWNDDSLIDVAWINQSTSTKARQARERAEARAARGEPAKPKPKQPKENPFATSWTAFQKRYGDRISKRGAYLGEGIVNRGEKLAGYGDGAHGLVHIDFRPDNMLFGTPEGGKPISVVDWQSVGYGPPAGDIGYCIAGALDSKTRQQHETELLEFYQAQLETLGAGPYPMDELKRHYVQGAYQLLFTAFFTSVLVEQTERGDKMFLKMFDGATDLIYDHKADGWLD